MEKEHQINLIYICQKIIQNLHAGGFTAGDKSGDVEMLSWLCSKGYAACGINYTLRNETNEKSVLSQSNEIKQAIPVVIEKMDIISIKWE